MGRMFAITGVMALSVAGCGDDGVWTKQGATYADYRTASYECERDTRMSAVSFGTSILAQHYAQEFFAKCMNTRGFYLQKASNTRAPADPKKVECLAQARDQAAADRCPR